MLSSVLAGSLTRLLVTSVALVFVSAGPALAQPSEKATCFDTSTLSPALREKSEAMLLDALDSEHLFTLATGLKPMSAGFFGAEVSMSEPDIDREEAVRIVAEHAQTDVDSLNATARARVLSARAMQAHRDELQELEDVRSILATWRCGDQILAELVHFANAHGNRRHLHAVVFALPRVREVLDEKSAFFSRWAFTPSTNPVEVLTAIEYARESARFAGYGYLFGYPDEAVAFFAAAGTSQEITGRFVTRDFRAIPTFQAEQGQFTYAVPKSAEESDADRELRSRAAPILAAYRTRRAAYIGEGKPGAAALLRDWFCPSDDHCSPADAAL